MNNTTFKEMNLPDGIGRAISELGFETATEIQAKSIPLIREGRDIIGKSQTGTGKTIAFGIPAIEAIDPSLPKKNVQVLILCPTRELALQAGDEIKKLSKYTQGINAVEVYGGATMSTQITKLKRASIVIGTPGRVMDHLRRRTMNLESLKMIVLDEADEMLSMGFREDIETILKDTPKERQTVLFSATMPSAIVDITKNFQHDPEFIAVNEKQITVDNIKQFYYDIPRGRKPDALSIIMQFHQPKRALLFVNTKRMVDELADNLKQAGIQAEGLHGDMKQMQRTKVMNEFKQGRCDVLVATDVAARGIDVNDIDFVINYDIPQNSEYYVHRIGRTGRAGKAGNAITLCCGRRQIQELMMLTKATKSKIEFLEIPNTDILNSKQKNTNVLEVEKAILKNHFSYNQLIEELVKNGYSEADIAKAALQLYFGEPKQYAQLSSSGSEGITSKCADGMCKIRLAIGKSQHVAPNHIVGAMTEATSLSGKDIGKIEIYGEYSLVSVPLVEAEQIISDMQKVKICGLKVAVRAYTDEGPRSDDKRRFRTGDRPHNRSQGSKPSRHRR